MHFKKKSFSKGSIIFFLKIGKQLIILNNTRLKVKILFDAFLY